MISLVKEEEGWFDLGSEEYINLTPHSQSCSEELQDKIEKVSEPILKSWALSTYVSEDPKGRISELVEFIYCLDQKNAFKDWTVGNVIWFNASLILTLWMNSFRGYAYWSQINEYIILGAIPLKDFEHNVTLETLGVKHVITLVKQHELMRWYYNPVIDWGEKIKQIIIPAADCEPLDHHQYKLGVEYLRACVTQQEITYVHCRAGVGRSGSLVVAYVAIALNISVEEAIECVKHIRPQLNLNQKQVDATDSFVISYKKASTVNQIKDFIIKKN